MVASTIDTLRPGRVTSAWSRSGSIGTGRSSSTVNLATNQSTSSSRTSLHDVGEQGCHRAAMKRSGIPRTASESRRRHHVVSRRHEQRHGQRAGARVSSRRGVYGLAVRRQHADIASTTRAGTLSRIHPLIGRVEVLVDQLAPARHRCDDGCGDRRVHRAHPPAARGARVGEGRAAGNAREERRSDRRVRPRLSRRLRRARRRRLDGRGLRSRRTRPPATTTPGQLSSALLNAMQQGDEAQIALLAQQAVDALAGFDDDAEHSERYYLHKVMRAIDLSRMLSAAMQQLRREGELTELELMLARNEFAEMLEQFRRRLAAEIAARMTDGGHRPSGRRHRRSARRPRHAATFRRWSSANCAAWCSRSPGSWRPGSAAIGGCAAPVDLIRAARFAGRCRRVASRSMS